MFLGFVILSLVILASTAWLTWRLDRDEEAIAYQSRLMEQTKKNIWELKTAFKLKFSGERVRDSEEEQD